MSIPRGRRRPIRFAPFFELESRLMPSLAVSCLGTVGVDLVGPSVSVGSDRIQDLDLRLTGLSGSSPIASIQVQDTGGDRWEYYASGTPQGGAHAEFFASASDPTQGDLYISPVVASYINGGATGPLHTLSNGDALTVTVNRSDGSSESFQTCVVAGLASPLATVDPAPLAATIVTSPDPSAVTVSWSEFANNGQDGTSWQPGAVHLRVGDLQGRQIDSATLSDSAGAGWSSTNHDHQYLTIQESPDHQTADIYFVPIRDETVVPTGTSAATNMVLRVTFAGDTTTQYVTRFAGGPWRTDLVASPISDANATPSDAPVSDETTLASRLLNETGQDTITLAPNATIVVTQPLVIGHSVRIIGQGATLLFRPSWTADVPGAIYLDPNARWADVFRIDFQDFHIAFDDSASNTWYDPQSDGQSPHAVINLMNSGQSTVNLSLDRMSIQGPAAFNPAPVAAANPLGAGQTYIGELSTTLILAQQAYGWTQESGSITNSTFRGGTISLASGPWQITGNTVLGAPAGTFSVGAFSFQSPHDVTLSNNQVTQDAPGGYLARLVNFHGASYNDLISGNTFSGGLPGAPFTYSTTRNVYTDVNAPEVILVEDYSVAYEGSVGAVTAGGYLLTLRTPSSSAPLRGAGPGPGSIVSILSTKNADGTANPHAGEWFRIAQVIATSPPTYLMETPLPAGSYDIIVSSGSVADVYSGNTIDLRGTPSHGIDLVGNQFGTQIIKNTFVGGGDGSSQGVGRGIFIQAANSEGSGQYDPSNPFPLPYSWTPLPMLGIVIDSNTLIDLPATIIVAVQHGGGTNTSSGRVYATATIDDNTIEWSRDWLSWWKGVFQSITNDNNNLSNSPDDSWIPPSITIGSGFTANYRVPGTVDGPSGQPNGPLGFIDPSELQVEVLRNTATIVDPSSAAEVLGSSSGQVFAGIVNGVASPTTPYPYNKPYYFQYGNSSWSDGQYFYAPFNAANLDITGNGNTTGGSNPSDPGSTPSDPGSTPSDPGSTPSDPGSTPSDPGSTPGGSNPPSDGGGSSPGGSNPPSDGGGSSSGGNSPPTSTVTSPGGTDLTSNSTGQSFTNAGSSSILTGSLTTTGSTSGTRFRRQVAHNHRRAVTVSTHGVFHRPASSRFRARQAIPAPRRAGGETAIQRPKETARLATRLIRLPLLAGWTAFANLRSALSLGAGLARQSS